MNIKLILAGIALPGLAMLLLFENEANRKLRLENTVLRAQADQARADRSDELPAGTEGTLTNAAAKRRGEHSELLRLRDEVTRLRTVQAEIVRLRANPTNELAGAGPRAAVDEDRENFGRAGISKLKYSRAWGMACLAFAQTNGNLMPETFAQAAPYYPKDEFPDSFGLAPDAFEIVFEGSIKDITKPATTIILRERLPFANFRQPGFSRTYVFADGRAEIKSLPDSNFEDWEKDKLAPPNQP